MDQYKGQKLTRVKKVSNTYRAMSVCLSVCLFSIEIQTAGRIGTKFGTEVVLEGGKVLRGVSTRYPHPPGMGCIKGVWGASGASTVRFDENFIKQMLQGTPDVVGGGHQFGSQIRIQKDLGPTSFWSHGHSL